MAEREVVTFLQSDTFKEVVQPRGEMQEAEFWDSQDWIMGENT